MPTVGSCEEEISFELGMAHTSEGQILAWSVGQHSWKPGKLSPFRSAAGSRSSGRGFGKSEIGTITRNVTSSCEAGFRVSGRPAYNMAFKRFKNISKKVKTIFWS